MFCEHNFKFSVQFADKQNDDRITPVAQVWGFSVVCLIS
jgi:hypothetical protein